MNHVFYETFERHAHGQGIKAHSTHYCPGCGHGLIHKYLSESIAELDIQDKTVAVSPVGCSVFLYYYMNVGNQQAAHGRASVVALAQKLARPDSIVVAYQGDGDLASIGLAEIVSVAQLGLPITVIFVNNSTYGMTGGQMAPTTLIGQKMTTCPDGRTPSMGQPMKVAELIAGLDGPVYVERVALFDHKSRLQAKRAIKKALQVQVEGKGFSFIEVVSECPVQLKLEPVKASEWVRENMLPVYPLGVKKDTVASIEEPPVLKRIPYDSDKLLQEIGVTHESAPHFAKAFPTHLDPDDVGIKFAGAGGDGAQTAALLLTRAALQEGFDSTHIPSYGPESRGGTSYADVHVAHEVLSPAVPNPHILVAFNAPSLVKFASSVLEGGIILYDSAVIFEVPPVPRGVKVYGIPFAEIAQNLGRRILKNVVCLGAFCAATNIFPQESFLEALKRGLKKNPKIQEINREAFFEGVKAFEAAYPDKR
ncbi:MAG: 2-oxoacid:acceptor oxidoreductase family protein [bacterium]|nr:2-oxoacid:acceptor oxidoreductase family protein [bacterium]